MEPSVLDHIPIGEFFDFPDLVRALLRAEEPVGAYRFKGIWFDIGRAEDYEQAVDAWTAGQTAAEELLLLSATNGHAPATKGHASDASIRAGA